MEVGTFTAAEASTGSRTMADLALAAGAKFPTSPPCATRSATNGWTSPTPSWPTRSGPSLGLIELGIQPGDKVAILSNTRPEWTYADFGILCAGATVAPIYQTNSPEECEYVLHHSEAQAVVRRGRASSSPRSARSATSCPTSRRSWSIDPTGDLDDAITLDELGAAPTARSPRPSTSSASPAVTPDDICHDHLHLRHHRPAEGLHAHPRQLPRDDHDMGEGESIGRPARRRSTSSSRSRTPSRADPVRGDRRRRDDRVTGSATRSRSSPT